MASCNCLVNNILQNIFFSLLLPEPVFLLSFHWFPANVAFGLLSWDTYISGNTVDLIAQILFELN